MEAKPTSRPQSHLIGRGPLFPSVRRYARSSSDASRDAVSGGGSGPKKNLLRCMADKAKMLMPQCPSCHSRLPLSEVFATSSVACPRCHRELKPQRWVVVVTTLLVIWTVQGVSYLAERSEFNLAVRLTVSTVCGLAAGALGHVLLVRYRLKDPLLSILQGDDALHRK